MIITLDELRDVKKYPVLTPEHFNNADESLLVAVNPVTGGGQGSQVLNQKYVREGCRPFLVVKFVWEEARVVSGPLMGETWLVHRFVLVPNNELTVQLELF